MAEKKLDQKQLSIFCGSIAMMLRSGITVADACALFAEDTDAEAANAAKAIVEELEAGETFADAAQHIQMFPEYALGVFRTAEYSGKLDDALDRLSDYYLHQYNLQQRLRGTLTYPVVLMLLMSGVLAVLVFSVLPMFETVYASLTGSLIASTYAYVTAAGIISRVSLAAAGIVSLGMLGLAAAIATDRGAALLTKRMETFPVTRDASRLLAVSKLSDILATLLSCGTDPDTAIQMAEAVTEHAQLRENLSTCREKMAQGDGLAESLFRAGIYPSLYGRMLIAGSESGNLSLSLAELSARQSKDAETALVRIIDTLEPVLISFLTVSVGMTLLSVMLPLLGILGAI